MLPTKVKQYHDERMANQPPPLYANTPVALLVALRDDGTPLNRRPTRLGDPSTARDKRGLRMAAPEVKRTSNIKPLLLADKGEYTFGSTPDSKEHAAYLELLHRCAVETEEPAVLAVRRFFEKGGADLLELESEWDYELKVTFEVNFKDGTRCRPIDLPAVRKFWLSVNTPDCPATGQCLVCGESKPVLDRLPGKIKGIRGGNSAGTDLISADKNAFESYGLRASRVAPTCRECGEAVTRGMNDLLAKEDSHICVGDATFIFWTRERVDFNPGISFQDPDAAEVQALLESVRRGRRAEVGDEIAFYAASLSASGGRAVVRDWIDTTVGSVAENVARWFELQRIIDPRDEDPSGLQQPRPLSLSRLATSTVRWKNGRPVVDDIPVTTPRSLFRSAFEGTPLPLELAFQAVRRCRVEQKVTRPRAALIKLVLLSQEPKQPRKDSMVALEPEHPDPTYHCGRLLAVLEEVQREAMPRVKATIVDRYFGSASSAPISAFPRLLRGAQPHLATLRKRENKGAYYALQRRLEKVCDQIKPTAESPFGFPKTLSLKEQALFSLGYYHQRAHDRARRDSQDGADENGTETTEEN